MRPCLCKIWLYFRRLSLKKNRATRSPSAPRSAARTSATSGGRWSQRPRVRRRTTTTLGAGGPPLRIRDGAAATFTHGDATSPEATKASNQKALRTASVIGGGTETGTGTGTKTGAGTITGARNMQRNRRIRKRTTLISTKSEQKIRTLKSVFRLLKR